MVATGRRNREKAMNLGTVVLGIIMAIAGLAGLAMSACGGLLILSGLGSPSSKVGMTFLIALPCLLIGVALVGVAVWFFFARKRAPRSEDP
jgi:hypothetical protein